jgi:glycosyltransferase involved in cell wall biosynthesis
VKRPNLEELSVGFVGTYPPTKCGIATFTESLRNAMAPPGSGRRTKVVSCVDVPGAVQQPPEVAAELVPGSSASRRAAALALDGCDVVVLQHEFGIFGGDDGGEVIDLVTALNVPVIAVLHTVPRLPSPSQRALVERLAELADCVVVQSAAAGHRLLEMHTIDPDRVYVIPHGAPANLAPLGSQPDPARSPIVLTWGLLGPDKGIEWGIEAMALLDDVQPRPRYVVLGQTHPRILETRGEEYREELVARAVALGVDHLVEFDNAYRDSASVQARIREADFVLLPYLSREQVVSGVLVEAIASGKPLISTRFPHAEELLGEGSGILVPHEDAEAIANALRSLVTDPALASRTAAVARRQAPTMFWENVGESYLRLANDVARKAAPVSTLTFPPPSFAHLLRISDDTGVFEHAKLTVPRLEHGYCTDDVARALIAVMREPRRSPELERLAATYLRFLEHAQLPDGRFHNRLSVAGRWTDEVGVDDTIGRALWALGTVSACAATREQRERARTLFEAGAGFRTPSPRANAFAVLGCVELLAATRPQRSVGRALELLEAAAAGLGRLSANPAWPWPEPRLAYANAVLAEARLAAGVALEDDRLVTEGLDLLAWLVETETSGDHFSFTPVGGRGSDSSRPAFDQQPIEAAAMADACARAFAVTGDPDWAISGLRAAAWFLGANDVGVPLLDLVSGGSKDGLRPTAANENQGAESTLAAITALQQARRLQAAARRASTTSDVTTLAAPTQRSAAPYVR